jgi:hypothetical protein
MEYLKIPFTPDQVYEMIRKLAIDNEVRNAYLDCLVLIVSLKGLIDYTDFKRAFQESEEEMESRGIGAESGGNFEPIPPKPIPELVDIHRVSITPYFIICHDKYIYLALL